MGDKQDLENIENPTDIDPVEARASEKGWVPQDEWEGDPDQWRPAKEFLDRGELMDRISSQSRQLEKYSTEVEELKDGLKVLAEHNKKVAKIEYEKAMKDLKSRKAEALSYGDHDTVVELDDQIDELKESKKEIEEVEQKPQQKNNGPHPDVVRWMESNSWYNNNMVMQGAADAIARQYLSQNPSAESDPSKVLDYVSREIRKEFPEKFGTKRKPSGTADPSSNGASRGASGAKKYTVKSLSPEQKTIAKRFAATGVMTEQEYVDQLAELGELG